MFSTVWDEERWREWRKNKDDLNYIYGIISRTNTLNKIERLGAIQWNTEESYLRR